MTFIGREKQLSTLRNIIDNTINFNVIVVHGPPSSGKSLILNHVLKEKNINHIYVSCRCIATVKQFFDVLLNGIFDKFQSNRTTKVRGSLMNDNKENNTSKFSEYSGWRNYSDYKQCTSSATFAHILQNEDFNGKKSFYIVVDHFQRLFQIRHDLISSLIQITEIESLLKATESKIGFILIDDSSSMINIKELLGNKHNMIFPVYFEQYNNKQIQQILLETTKDIFKKQTNLNETQRKLVIKLLVNTFNFQSRRIRHFHQYLALLIPDIHKNGYNQTLNKQILKLYEKVTKSQHLCMEYKGNDNDQRREPDLPYASKLLLLASYLASYNSSKWNEHQFTDILKKRTKRRKAAPKSKKNEYSLKYKGAQTWTLRDLSGIFIELFKRESPSIFNKDLKHIHDIHSQIAHLISLSFISIISRQGVLDDIKFKSNIDHDFAKFIANKIGIRKWENYLEPSA